MKGTQIQYKSLAFNFITSEYYCDQLNSTREFIKDLDTEKLSCHYYYYFFFFNIYKINTRWGNPENTRPSYEEIEGVNYFIIVIIIMHTLCFAQFGPYVYFILYILNI